MDISKKRSGTMTTASLSQKMIKKENSSSVTYHHHHHHHETSSAVAQKKNPYLSTPVQPEKVFELFLTQVRNTARTHLPPSHVSDNPVVSTTTSSPCCEVEMRLGVLKVPHAFPERRVCSSGAKHVNNALVQVFDCSNVKNNIPHHNQRCAIMESGVSRSHYMKWTGGGVSEMGPIALALGVRTEKGIESLKRGDIVEIEMVETVYAGYRQGKRACFPGLHESTSSNSTTGKLESKEKLHVIDLTVPAAFYDLRLQLATEKIVDERVRIPPAGWTHKRIKRRRSYFRRDHTIGWRIDVTEVTLVSSHTTEESAQVNYEIEFELLENVLLQLIHEEDTTKLEAMTKQLAQQLWWILSQINPIADALDVEEMLHAHRDKQAVQLALATCGALKRFADNPGTSNYDSPACSRTLPAAAMSNVKFIGCMPINFSRHNMDEIQRSSSDTYFLSEKTDGVRHLMVFTRDTVVLLDRDSKGKQPHTVGGDPQQDPFATILSLIQPGTVLDGEVVMNRRGKRPRPIFIVFDVMAVGAQPILHLPFADRLRHLRQATFRTDTASRDMFDPKAVLNPHIALPLVRKNFVKRTEVDELLSHVMEERGMRCYQNGDLHYHLTDGIIFQPNLPYVCGTDRNLLKWKFLDTVTIDVRILEERPSYNNHSNNNNNAGNDNALRVECMGEENTSVNLTRYVVLCKSERLRLEADKFESGKNIAEVGFDPETGDWYYRTMRVDKSDANHISTVLGTLLELSESLTTEELRYRLSIPAGQRDMYRKDTRKMLNQLLDHHRKQLRDYQQHKKQSESQTDPR